MEDYNLKYALTHLSKKGQVLLVSGGLVLTITGIAGVSMLTGCGKTDDHTENENDISTEASSEETAEKVIEATTEITTNNDYSEDYKIIDNMEEDIVAFAKANLPNGFIEVNEDNKLDMAKKFTDAYVMMNLSSNKGQITPKTVGILNQSNILIPSEVKDNYKDFAYVVGEYMLRVEPSTMIDFEVLVQEQDDAKFLNELETEIANMNVAKTAEERQTRINKIIEIKDSILTNASTTSYSSSTLYMAINMIIEADAKARAYGNEVFPDEEAKLQLYTTLYDFCLEESEEYNFDLNIEDVKVASQTSFESIYFTSVAEKVIFAITNNQITDADKKYAYEEVTARIADKILGLYKAPAMTNIDAENAVRASLDAQNTPEIGSSTSYDVDPDDVPADQKVSDTKTPDYSDGQSTNDADHVKPSSESDDTYINAKGAGTTDGSAAAAALYASSYTGHAADMPTRSVGAAPAKTASYDAIYTYFYNKAWNDYVAERIKIEADAKQQDEQATTEFQPATEATTEKVSESTEQITTEEPTTEEPTTEKQTTESTTHFEPVTGGDSTEEIIDEKIENVTSKRRNLINELKALRASIVYHLTAYSEDIAEKCNIRRG